MKTFFLFAVLLGLGCAKLARDVGYEAEDLTYVNADCGACKLSSDFETDERVTFNPQCLSGKDTFGCTTNRITGQMNGCQLCEHGAYLGVSCGNPSCSADVVPEDFGAFCKAFVKPVQGSQRMVWDPDCLDGGRGCIGVPDDFTLVMEYNGCKYCGGSYGPCNDVNHDGLDDDWVSDDDPHLAGEPWTHGERKQQRVRAALRDRIYSAGLGKYTGKNQMGMPTTSLGLAQPRLYSTGDHQHWACQAHVSPGSAQRVEHDQRCLPSGGLGCISDRLGRFDGCKYCGHNYGPCDDSKRRRLGIGKKIGGGLGGIIDSIGF